ncbi:IST1-like protein [Senna tora]|uniref:IST1-like protein n=1 Tax=Senna tora TaxID=362788 RepID=A0A834SKC2_9FABA|nr:IST1-like protein [Senna tora]
MSMDPPPKYVMLDNNGLHPPPHRRHIPRYHEQESSGGGCSCMKCFCFCYCCIFILLLLAFAATGFMFLIFDPKVPSYQVENFSVKKFDIQNGNKLNTEFTVVVKTHNPNEGISLEYGKDSEVNITYLDAQIGSGPIPEFRQPAKNTTVLEVVMKGRGDYSAQTHQSLMQDQKQGKIPLKVQVRVPVTLVVQGYSLREFKVIMTAHVRDSYRILDMFEFLFGWSKASKCKKVIKRARCRLKLLKNKRHAIVRQSREDLAELIKKGFQETAVNRVEQLIKDESLATAYELLDHFCEFILTQLSYIRRHKDCPNDINEAASSLIYASARCGDLPELCAIRKLFGQRYGHNFAATAMELFPGNLVNNQLKESLSEKCVPDDLKYRVVDEIARDYCLQPEVLAIEYYPDWQQMQVKEIKGYQVGEEDAQINDTIAGSEIHDYSSIHNFLSKPGDSCSPRESNTCDTSALVSTVQQYPPYIHSFPLGKKVDRLQNFTKLHSFTTFGLVDKAEMLEYFNNTEESRFSVPKDGSNQDQKLLKLRSSESEREKTQYVYDPRSDLDGDESESEKSSMRNSRKSMRVVPENRSRRRSTSLENQGIRDIACMVYYHKPSRNPSSHKSCPHHSLKHQKPLVGAFPQTDYVQNQKKLKHEGSSETETNGCSLDHPCYSCVCNDVRNSMDIKIQQEPIRKEESKEGMKLVSIPQRAVYNVFTYPDCDQCEKQKNARAPESYSRAATMPQERQKSCMDKMVRTYSCPSHSQNPNHVHPKLPDYDDIAAKFTALKRERLENKE